MIDRRVANPLESEFVLLVGLLGTLIVASLAVFWAVCDALHPAMSEITIAVRGTAFLAFFLLQIAVLARPLARLHPVFRSLDRKRHFLLVAVLMLGLSHVALVLTRLYLDGSAFTPPPVIKAYAAELLLTLSHPSNVINLPFEPFGALALALLLPILAARHAFWRRNLGRHAWKGLQLLLYPAYAAVLAHFVLGFVQSEFSIFFRILVLACPVLLLTLHLAVLILKPKARCSPRRATAMISQPAALGLPPSPSTSGDHENDEEDDDLYPVSRNSSATAMPFRLNTQTAPVESGEASTVGAGTIIPPEAQRFLGDPGLFVLFLAPLFMAGIATFFSAYEPGRAYPNVVTLEGVYHGSPVPQLLVQPEWNSSSSETQHILLSLRGDSRSDSMWAALDGKRVRVQGHLRYRALEAMLEADAASPPFPLGDSSSNESAPALVEGEPVTISGELISMRCYLGTSWPATGKLHRSCAITCLAKGDTPGVLLGSGTSATTVVLVGRKNAPLQFDPSLAGVQVRVSGTFFPLQGFSYLEVDSLKRQD